MTDISHPAPNFDRETIAELLKTHWDLKGALSPLESERDQNHRLDAEDGTRWTVKIVNASEPEAETGFQTAMLQHLAVSAPELPMPRLRLTNDGSSTQSVVGPDGVQHAMRVVSWVTGVPLAETKREEAVVASLGTLLGKMDKALRGFVHPGALRSFEWDLRAAGDARDRLTAIGDPDHRRIVEYFSERFDRLVAPKLAGLRAAVIHNDANDWNVLVDPDDHSRVCGLIDFGDSLHTPVIAEVAIAAAYTIMEVADPIGAAADLAAAYHAEYPLEEGEVDLLFDLIAMRLVTSVSLSALRKDETEDNPYLAVSEAPAWNLLYKLYSMKPAFATAILRKACGFEAVPGARKVAEFCAKNRNSFAGLFERHPKLMSKAMVPYGDPQNEMTVKSRDRQPEAAQEWWEDYCEAHDVELGIGPWGESRSVYSSDFFESRFIEGERRRNHLGFDLFLPSGTRVCAPMDGKVRSVVIETDPLGYGCMIALDHETDCGQPFVSLWGHMAHEAASRLKAGDVVRAGETVGYLGAEDENGGWAPHLHLQLSADVSLSAEEILGVGEEKYLDVWADLFPSAIDFAGLPQETLGSDGRSVDEIVSSRRQNLLPNLSISYSEPIKFVRGEGAYLIDHRGRAYLDCFNNVCHLGHAHPEVVEALSHQAGLLNTNTRYLHDNIVEYSERLTATLPDDLAVASFVCTGSEANSLMIRMAEAHTGRRDAVVLDWAYHGTTPELIALSPYKYKRNGGKGRPDHVFEAAIPDAYRAPADWAPEEITARYVQSVAEQLDLMKKQGRAPAFFIAESIPSVAGQVFMPDGYLDEVYKLIRAEGGLCVADEVQVGFGRVGSHWWAFETQGVTPDVVTMGKPIGNGHPMAALVTTREVAKSFNNGMEYFNTFGGNPVSCAVGLSVLNVIERDGLRENARVVGDYILSGFHKMMEKYEFIGDVRGMGLFLGVELVKDRKTKEPATDMAKRVANRAKDLGILMGTEGPYDNVLKMRPPMIFSKENADYLLDVLDQAMNESVSALETM
ncbi:aminotransferase class III-fold pyridoxal phosphate-dependent enzyme [Pseudovibrio brasiliensis]|uniref:Aminotransferase class III-fold pyridoxal phosphate-dependent enzyme n=1 Tax=Pseudovibrio brasiliensis TaxID=1898042 RepID=A0ABX8AKR3_9HYPH|nr:aminotransferase class III-fold pyridoxal phosphate-dependent enzyme [Pseudovibrio brasiliensis]QUS54246.1 aminotransferase class III-fold pyridoxal phosphate-dependent enzyme [Pseudovibrio brasiliensis]